MSNKGSSARLITIQGAVQRVGFRRYAEVLARRHKLTGYVQNNNDGTVLLFVQGQQDTMDKLAEEIKNAPKPIEVDSIIVKKARTIGSIKSFKIKSGPLVEEIQEGFGAMQSEFRDYRQEFKDYKEEFRDYRQEFKDYRGDFNNFAVRTDENFKTMDTKYGEISSKLSVMLQTFEKELTETRIELKKSVDRLSDLVDQYIRMQQPK